MRKVLLITIVFTSFFTVQGFCQDTQQLIGQVAQIYTGNDGSDSGIIGGFSLWGLVGAFIFSGIGFIAFIFGRKNSEFRPMLIGLALMVYPYFFRGSIALYLVGIALVTALYFWKE